MELAHAPDLAAHLFAVLGSDVERDVRFAVASRADCLLATLQRLEHDEDAAVRAAAAGNLSNALRPGSLSPGAVDPLFDRGSYPPEQAGGDEAAYGSAYVPIEPGPPGPMADEGPTVAEVLCLVEVLTGRLSELEAQLGATLERLDVIAAELARLTTPVGGVPATDLRQRIAGAHFARSAWLAS